MIQTKVVTRESFDMTKANAIKQLSTAKNLGYNGNPAITFENMLFIINDITSMYDFESEELETELFGILRKQIINN